jgi:magnesium transporter
MITGYIRKADGQATGISNLDELAGTWPAEGAALWLDCFEPDLPELQQLKDIFRLDEGSIEDCLTGEQRPRIDEFDDHIFLVLYGLIGPDDHELDPRKLAIFCGSQFLITVHAEPLRTVQTVLGRCSKNAGQILASGVDFVLYQLIDGVVDRYIVVVDGYEKRIEVLEDQSLEPEVEETLLSDVAEVRRDILEVRSLAVSLRELLYPIGDGEYAYISESLEQRFSHVHDHLSQVLDAVDRCREHLGGIRDNYHTALANRTNAIMKALTLMATIMLPLSLIAGIYGMNLPLWPPPDAPLSFWAVVGSMVAIAVGLLLYFRRKHWL